MSVYGTTPIIMGAVKDPISICCNKCRPRGRCYEHTKYCIICTRWLYMNYTSGERKSTQQTKNRTTGTFLKIRSGCALLYKRTLPLTWANSRLHSLRTEPSSEITPTQRGLSVCLCVCDQNNCARGNRCHRATKKKRYTLNCGLFQL